MTGKEALKNNLRQKIDISDKDFDLFYSKTRGKKFKKKEMILREGDVCKYASLIISGAGRGYIINDKAEDKTILLGVEDWWLQDFQSYITGQPSRMNIEAMEETEVVQMSFQDLQGLFDQSQNIERFIRLMAMNAFVASQTRLMDLMTNTTDNRYEIFIQKYPHFFQRFPQYIIASYLNVTPEHLSTVRAKLSKK